ncbi:MAG: hypothetical protein JRD68_09220 [Deltaproteobacteria bacterium]|nr:hypothetical protein [Deltaproteobacteria bacterium]
MSVEGKWNLKVSTPMGEQAPVLTINVSGNECSGIFAGAQGSAEFSGGSVEGDNASFTLQVEAMGQKIDLQCNASVDGDKISGELKSPMGPAQFSGERA